MDRDKFFTDQFLFISLYLLNPFEFRGVSSIVLTFYHKLFLIKIV